MQEQAFLPLTETTLFILLSLAPGPNHGYAIMKDVEGLSGGRINLSTGTLYGAIKRLLESGWIERVQQPEPNGRDRKAYALTELGRTVLNAEVERLRGVVDAALTRTSEAGV
jgi:DNA-binding PadR family transcriptional regulator